MNKKISDKKTNSSCNQEKSSDCLHWMTHEKKMCTQFKPTINIQIEYSVLFSCSVGGHTGILATISGVCSSHSECAAIRTDPEHKGSIASSS